MLEIIYFFLIGFILEFVVVYLFLKKDFLKVLGFVLLINLFTWPIANLLYGFNWNVYLIEIGVVIVEGFLIMELFKIDSKKSLLISFVANLISFLIGLTFF